VPAVDSTSAHRDVCCAVLAVVGAPADTTASLCVSAATLWPLIDWSTWLCVCVPAGMAPVPPAATVRQQAVRVQVWMASLLSLAQDRAGRGLRGRSGGCHAAELSGQLLCSRGVWWCSCCLWCASRCKGPARQLGVHTDRQGVREQA
jgi:hypothetical protein